MSSYTIAGRIEFITRDCGSLPSGNVIDREDRPGPVARVDCRLGGRPRVEHEGVLR